MAAINPDQPSQPSAKQGYETSGNPVTKQPQEQQTSARNAADDSAPVDQRIPRHQTPTDGGTPSALGRGIRGAGAGERREDLRDQDALGGGTVEAEQMAAPGEGAIAAAVQEQSGGAGGEPGLERDLERKKAEQAPLRERVKKEEERGVDVQGVLGQSGGS